MEKLTATPLNFVNIRFGRFGLKSSLKFSKISQNNRSQQAEFMFFHLFKKKSCFLFFSCSKILLFLGKHKFNWLENIDFSLLTNVSESQKSWNLMVFVMILYTDFTFSKVCWKSCKKLCLTRKHTKNHQISRFLMNLYNLCDCLWEVIIIEKV